MLPRSLAADGASQAKPLTTKILIPALPRSGSTLLLEMVTDPVTKSAKYLQPFTGRRDLRKFALFEPCHEGDIISGRNVQRRLLAQDDYSCDDLLNAIAACDFSKIDKLWGWSDIHTRGTPDKYSIEAAGEACQASDLVAFKTVTDAFWRGPHPVEDRLIPFLDSAPDLKAVVNVRDPRAIYASWKAVFGNRTWSFNESKMSDFCKYYAGLARNKHPRLLVIKFEEMVENPYATLKKIYSFLGFAFGKPQANWIRDHFWQGEDNMKGCGHQSGGRNYSTCRRNPKGVVDRWIYDLGASAKHFFLHDPTCRMVADFFGYDTSIDGAPVRQEVIMPAVVQEALKDPKLQAAIISASDAVAEKGKKASLANAIRDALAAKQH